MKENTEKYVQVFTQSVETNIGNKQKRRKRNDRIASTMRDNDKSTQVFLCCGQEVTSNSRCAQYVNKKK